MFAQVRPFALRLVQSLRPASRDAEAAREIAAHLALMEQDFERQGMAPEAARRAASARFGGIGPAVEQHRDTRAFRWLLDARQDLRYAVRMLGRAPGFAAVAVCSLALGIGANTILFSVLDTFLFRTLPVPAPDRLVNLREIWPGGRVRTEVPHWEYTAMRAALSDVMDVAAVAVFDRSNIGVGGATDADSGPVESRSSPATIFRSFRPPPRSGAHSRKGMTVCVTAITWP